jgi:hypothetical protein
LDFSGAVGLSRIVGAADMNEASESTAANVEKNIVLRCSSIANQNSVCIASVTSGKGNILQAVV